MKALSRIHKKVYILFVLVPLMLLAINCTPPISNKNIIGTWKLTTIIFYSDGEETTYLLKDKSYITSDGEDELLEYHDKGPVTYTFNNYNELIVKYGNGQLKQKIQNYKFEGNKFFIGSLEIPIQTFTKNKLVFIENWATFAVSSESKGGKMAFTYVLNKM